ncbi:23S rRNA (pseudouridine(1915)-N(3))-methyltransferase RlmH [Nitratiruptor sp. YY09-18]|uniref:23S rRNA (pseudouridine(1915)-N(3))-methyltransferase RlmH n=1 Tax=Nitratiruptor sp. YY09-18 TaxID=2724901 RepID=UPI001916A897|nr:23S rRNA (pseudouridine(1915)-N(3))-methyltransferase RlmH [Nitratiruptor sp. YY09-18]BCD67804.1 23S rRNA (pseudouridine1915-N3)-methyltransferase [Nitratiruptor sp. YY09-18]
MHKIFVYSIGKKDEPHMQKLYEELIKNAKKYATIKVVNIYNKKINQAQSAESAQKVYTKALEPYILNDGLNIALHPDAKEPDSYAFSKILQESAKIAFFIGGAYGFEERFLKMCDKSLSLSRLTMSHKIAKAVLLEQIFRGLSLIHNHPYHK